MTYTQEQLDVALAAPTQAQAARALNVPGKSFRDGTRGVFGVFVSRDGEGADAAWVRVRAYRIAYAARTGDARAAVVAAWKAGDPLPDAPDTSDAQNAPA